MTNKPELARETARPSISPDAWHLRNDTDKFRTELIALIPQLRGLARSMCSSRVLGEDMVQSALSKAWASRASYQLGTNLRAWLFTILRNEISSHRRRAWRETHWDKAAVERMPSVPDEHQAAVDLSDIERALRSLPETQREGLILVGAGGVSYEDSAAICNVAVETVKSRVARGRAALIEILDGTDRRPLTTRAVPDRAMVDILAHLGALTRSGPAQATAFPA